jgi:ABC-type transporter Mla maintaining outer membrane lipid asymmetry ATPase subunit MlaF
LPLQGRLFAARLDVAMILYDGPFTGQDPISMGVTAEIGLMKGNFSLATGIIGCFHY